MAALLYLKRNNRFLYLRNLALEDYSNMKLTFLLLCIACLFFSITHAANPPALQTVNKLKLVLAPAKQKYKTSEELQLFSSFENIGEKSFSLMFWWNRRILIIDSKGKIVPPKEGPQLPCGATEYPTEIQPGKTVSRKEPLKCTQPIGAKEDIGWSYQLKPGTYKISLIYQSPSPYSYGRIVPQDAWKGKVTSNAVEVTIE